jgi:putative transcriptional regulator
MKLLNSIVLVLAFVAGASPVAAREIGVDEAVLLAASPALEGPFARTVLLALPTGEGTHIGFVLNRPSSVKVSAVFPEVASAKEVATPVFVGGPESPELIVALTLSPHAPTEEALAVLPGLYMSFGHEEAARVAGRFPRRSRFYSGFVAWDRGELQGELDAGVWQMLEPDVDIVTGGSPDTLWQRVLERTRTLLASAQFFRR